VDSISGDLRGDADTFLVFTSNVFAILGCALYFALRRCSSHLVREQSSYSS